MDYVPPPPDSRRTSVLDLDPSLVESQWEDPGNDELDLEMMTEVMDGGEVDEEVSLSKPRVALSRPQCPLIHTSFRPPSTS